MLPVLLGYRGCGKTTVGRALATRLGEGVGHVDTDALVEAAAELGIPAIFELHGEPAFRDMEAEAVAAAVDPEGVYAGDVVSLGGGAVLRDDTQRQLRASGRPLVYLRCPDDVLASRIGDGSGRPSLTGGGAAAEVAAVMAERGPVYGSIATHVVDATGSVDLVADAIIALLDR